ncbi:aryl-alcohol dehydrogenase-like predicted oxidoreductase [Tumebacillus sp. BK434]|uniref:aldo/keto reductase n=1 Tax=Tumebacillus sp. BK434 TaxID=2512169 RepID=UPI0010D6CCDF|nr:aldo/keto reductase [Tumebacillus sp. BK434]TCP52443.1 aryl-alcohol dehydrogenase-like predicted oxidoreductase [Tumebacillus sp. BK434]
MILGNATAEGTKAYMESFADLQHCELGRTGLLVSQAGFGCYRVDVSVEEHRMALRKALQCGVNLIDTSANYGDGGSEELVGAVLEEMIAAGEAGREQVVVVSKAGYLQGQNYLLSQERKREGRPFPDLVSYGPGLEHCIHPVFLADQLTRSLARLRMERLDVYLLHNPEYYLMAAKQENVPPETARAEYERRLELAFRHLEREVEQGRIGCYGISSNTFPARRDDVTFTSLEDVLALAEKVSAAHHFRVIQLPMNLVETGGMTEANQAGGKSVLELAVENELGVLINRPLNAIVGGRLVRLADGDAVPVDVASVQTQVERLAEAERSLKEKLLAAVLEDDQEREEAADKLSAGRLLQEHWRSFSSAEHWREVQGQFLVPTVQTGIRKLLESGKLTTAAAEWVEAYVDGVNGVLPEVTAYYQWKGAEQVRAITSRAEAAAADWAGAGRASHLALRALRSTQGVSSVLVGMRRAAYVEDVIAELKETVAIKPRRAEWEALS